MVWELLCPGVKGVWGDGNEGMIKKSGMTIRGCREGEVGWDCDECV
jgi:hypothetical protein